jgi:hypothetical protein
MRTAARTISQPTSSSSRIYIGWAVTRWWVWFFRVCGNIALGDRALRWNVWILLLQWAEY